MSRRSNGPPGLFGIDSLGDDYDFPVPTVQYTVPEPEQKPGPEDTAKPRADNTKKLAKKAKGGVPKTGDGVAPAAVAGLLVAGVVAGAAGVAARRRNRWANRGESLRRLAQGSQDASRSRKGARGIFFKKSE